MQAAGWHTAEIPPGRHVMLGCPSIPLSPFHLPLPPSSSSSFSAMHAIVEGGWQKPREVESFSAEDTACEEVMLILPQQRACHTMLQVQRGHSGREYIRRFQQLKHGVKMQHTGTCEILKNHEVLGKCQPWHGKKSTWICWYHVAKV